MQSAHRHDPPLRASRSLELRARADPSRWLDPAAWRVAGGPRARPRRDAGECQCGDLPGSDASRAWAVARELGGDLSKRIRPHLDQRLNRIPIAVRCHVGAGAALFDGLLHRPPEGGLMIELERRVPPVDLRRRCRERRSQTHPRGLVAAHARRRNGPNVQDLTGYDRVMVYRFDEEGHGEVLSERRRAAARAVPGQPLSRVRHPANRAPAVRAQPGAGAG